VSYLSYLDKRDLTLGPIIVVGSAYIGFNRVSRIHQGLYEIGLAVVSVTIIQYRRCAMRYRSSFVCAMFALVSIIIAVHAKEIIIYDVRQTITESCNGFAYFQPDPRAGTNWLTPDNYYTGKWEARFEIFNYPSNERATLCICIWAKNSNEMCGSFVDFSKPGVYTVSVSPSTYWKLGGQPVDFSRVGDLNHLGIVFWCNGQNMSPWVSPNCWDQRAKFLPMTLRLTLIGVSAGSVFSGWDTYGYPVATQPNVEPGRSKTDQYGHKLTVQKNGSTLQTKIADQGEYRLDVIDYRGKLAYQTSGSGPCVESIPRNFSRGIYMITLRNARGISGCILNLSGNGFQR